MKYLIIVSLFLASVSVFAAAGASNFADLAKIDDFLDNDIEKNAEEVELDAQGRQSMQALEAFAKEHPADFLAQFEENETSLGLEDGRDFYCEDGNPVYLFDAKSRRRPRTARSGGGSRCVPSGGRILQGCCLMYVRSRLGLPISMPDSASQAGPTLLNHGYCRKSVAPEAAPVNAVLVYSGGNNGHIELKTGPNSYYFGPTNREPASSWQSNRRRLTGVYVKCGR